MNKIPPYCKQCKDYHEDRQCVACNGAIHQEIFFVGHNDTGLFYYHNYCLSQLVAKGIIKLNHESNKVNIQN